MLRPFLCLLLFCLSFSGLSAQDFAAETLVCRTGAFVLESPLTDGASYRYQWERSFDGGTSWLPTGSDAAQLTIITPNEGIRYRLAYAPDAVCLADPGCRQLTAVTRLLITIPSFNQGLTLCAGDTALVGNQPLTTAGSHETILETPAGCDSVVTTFLQILPAYDDLFFVNLCPGETFRGTSINRDTIIRETFNAASGCDSIVTFEISIAFGDTPSILGPDRICAGETAELSSPGLYAAYAWTTGADDENTEVTSPGTYALTLTDFTGCQITLTHELTVTEVRIDDLITSGPACPGTASGTLSVRASGDDDLLYSADGGASFGMDTSFTDLAAGAYEIVVESADGCRAGETIILVDAPELRLTSEVPEELTIERGDSVSLAVLADFPDVEYRWSGRNFISCDDCAAPLAYPSFDATYTVEAIAAGGCSVSRSFRIVVNDNRRMYVPTAFSPNNDDRNDRWRIFTGPRAEAVLGLQIADRWGGIRYVQPEAELSPADAGWDGRDGAGQELNAGTYLYTATVRFTDGTSKVIGGEITLMR